MSRSTTTIFALVALIAVFVLYRFVDNSGTFNGTASVVEQQPYSDWKDFTAPSGKFKGRFPMTPRHVSESSQDPRSNTTRRYNIYVAEQLDATAYMVTSINFVDKFNPENNPHVLDDTVSDMVSSNAQNVLVSKEETKIQGLKAVKFKIDNGKMTQIEGLVFVADKTLYILTRISKMGTANEEDFDHFIKSFSIQTGTSTTK